MKLTEASKRVLITGATGFIGGRLAEVLVSARGVDVTALVRNFSRVARISRHRIRLHRADLLNSDTLGSALEGVDTVFHCAYEWGQGDKRERETNVNGTLNLARAAKERGVRRFVYTSTMAVYGYDLPATVTEETPYRPATPYGRIKCEAERALREFGKTHGLEVVVVQPTKVFGPYDFNFTVPFSRKLIARQLWLIEQGSGLVSPSYVDNLVHGLLLAAEKPDVAGGVFILADGATLRWSEFVEAFSRLVNGGPFGRITRAECDLSWKRDSRNPGLKALLHALFLNQEARQIYPRYAPYRGLRRLLSSSIVGAIKRVSGEGDSDRAIEPLAINRAPQVPGINEYRDFTRRGAFSIARAQRELGYAPSVSFADALERTKGWLQYARIVEAGT